MHEMSNFHVGVNHFGFDTKLKIEPLFGEWLYAKAQQLTFIPLKLQMPNIFQANAATSNNVKICNVFWNTIY